MRPSSKSHKSPKRSKSDTEHAVWRKKQDAWEKKHFYDHVPLDFFCDRTKKLKLFDKVIDKACEETGCNRKARYNKDGEIVDGPWYWRGTEDVRFHIAQAECELGLRKEMPWFSPGDNEYG